MNKKLQILNTKSILLVEDDELTRIAITQGLKPFCELFISATNGADGLEKFRQNRIDMIITDINMPQLNGLDMISEILKLKPDQNFIVVTSYDSEQNLLESVKKGVISFIKKPIMMENLQNALVVAMMKNTDKIITLSENISVNLTKEKIFVNGCEIYLSKLENSIFWLLCYNLGNLVSYEMIEDYAYNGNSIKTGSIHTAIVRIKKQLNTLNITNISGCGYVLKC